VVVVGWDDLIDRSGGLRLRSLLLDVCNIQPSRSISLHHSFCWYRARTAQSAYRMMPSGSVTTRGLREGVVVRSSGFGHRDRNAARAAEFFGQDYHYCRVLSRPGRQNAGVPRVQGGAERASHCGRQSRFRTVRRSFCRSTWDSGVMQSARNHAERTMPRHAGIACRGILFGAIECVCVADGATTRCVPRRPVVRGGRLLAIR
jgi:hypothetical protein